MRVRQRLLASGVTTLASTTSSWSSCLKSRRPEVKKESRVMELTIKSELRGAEQHLVWMTRKVGASPVEQRRKVQPACGCHNFFF